MRLEKLLRGAMTAFVVLSTFSPLWNPSVPVAEAASPAARSAARRATHITEHRPKPGVRFNEAERQRRDRDRNDGGQGNDRGRTQGVDGVTSRLEAFNAFETNVIQSLGLNTTDVQSISFNNSDPDAYGVVAASNAAGFPLQGGDFFAMSTGQLASWDDANVPDTTGFLSATSLRSPGQDILSFSLGNCANVPGGTLTSCGAYEGKGEDMARMTLTLVPPTGYTSLTFSYKFLSEEYPDYVGSSYNDSFIVEKGSSTFSVDSSLTFQSMGNNIAVDSGGRPINVSSNFFTSGNPASNAVNTTYNGGSGVLNTTVAGLTPGQAFTLVFSVLDVGDSQLDSAVFLDNFVWGGLTESGTGQGTPPTYTPASGQVAVCGTASSFNIGSFVDGDGSPWAYSVSWGDSTANSTGTASAQGNLGALNHTYAAGGTYTVTVTVTDSTGGAASGTFTVTVNCNFTLTTNASPAAGGTVTPATGPVLAGTTVNVTQTPNVGYTFTGWSGDCTGTGACSVTMSGAKSVTANYSQINYTVSVNVTGDGWANGNGTYHYGDTATINGGPFPGSSFGSITGGGCSTIPAASR